MTRCYEFYCAYEHNPKFCVDKGDRIVDYIEEYITFMRTKGIQFDKTPTDKARFASMVEHYGSEYAVTQTLKKEDFELPIKTQELAQPILPIQTPKEETSIIQPSLVEKSVESCPVCQPKVWKNTEVIIECPICNAKYLLAHSDNEHKLAEVI